jgi:hypothetical protein
MIAKGITYSELAQLMTSGGTPETDQNLRNKIGRGSFTAAFLLQVSEAMGLDVELVERKGRSA